MKPKGSGLFVWLNQQLAAEFPALVTTHDYRDVVKRLEAMDDPRAAKIAAEFHVRDKADSRFRAQRDRKRLLAGLEEQAQLRPQDTFLAKRIEKLKRSIAKAAIQENRRPEWKGKSDRPVASGATKYEN